MGLSISAQTEVQEQQSINDAQAIGLLQQLNVKSHTMDETRVQAAMAEMNALIQSLMQRCINLAGDLAVAHKEIEALKQPKEPQP